MLDLNLHVTYYTKNKLNHKHFLLFFFAFHRNSNYFLVHPVDMANTESLQLVNANTIPNFNNANAGQELILASIIYKIQIVVFGIKTPQFMIDKHPNTNYWNTSFIP